MKSYIRLFTLFVFAATVGACEKNAVGPSYEKIGTSTSTNAFITVSPVSATAPTTDTELTITLRYVNVASDPAKSLVLKLREGNGDFTTIQTFDESNQSTGVEHTRTVNYTVTQPAGTSLTFRLELTTQVEFPKLVDRAAFPVR
ncbi:hypothetical protein SAMN05421747_1112 [Parapedobacter composti]|uniref:Uncharacterized protein n=1 Tax=Parapedobacter composti TaxID=623281 RepID=A0A1I1J3R5_9SPHI|nr:hypothetical protein [Parapedobacter composti]SFC43197.1 hypothetical protein SAMN05421747_1112 [Parapedobacter composti]